MSDQCIENWTKKGWCHCDTCNAYGEAHDATCELSPRSIDDVVKHLIAKTGQSHDVAMVHIEQLTESGILVEIVAGSGLWRGCYFVET